MTSYADMIEHAMRDTRDLVPWAEANDDLQMFPALSEPVRLALSGPVPDDCAFAVPLLRSTDPHVSARPILAAVLDWKHTFEDVCIFCKGERFSANRLTVLAGASAVWLHFCPSCSRLMDETFPGLSWDQREGE